MINTINYSNKQMNLLLFININDIKKQEQNLLETKFKNIFLSSISHNLKTPLNSNFYSQYIS